MQAPIRRLTLSVATLAVLGGLFAQSGQALNNKYRVALVASATSGGTGDCHFTDVRDKLLLTNAFTTIDIIDTTTMTPMLSQLLQYDSVLVWTDAKPLDNDAWGDVMADYVDAGGGVVVGVFAVTAPSGNSHLGGRWESGGYEVILSQKGHNSGHSIMGNVLDPTHPIMDQVTHFDGGTSSIRPLTKQMTPGSKVIAEWDDGLILVAVGANPRRADLGFLPPSKDCSSIYWLTTSDGARLMANALVYVAQTPIVNYCTAKTPLVCGPSTITSEGRSSATTSSGFVLHSAPVRTKHSGQLLYTDSGPSAIPFQGGILCVSPTPLRFSPIVNSGGQNVCDGTLSLDVNAFAAGQLGGNPAPFLKLPGTTVYAQFYGRDSVATGALLSDATEWCVGL